MIKKSLVAFTLLVAGYINAQEGTASPYSFYGIGDVRFSGTHENRAMGGINMLKDSTQLNFINPASYANLNRVVMTLGATNKFTKLKTDDSNDNSNRTTLDYLALGLPVGNFGVGFGLAAHSSVGYKTRTVYSDLVTSQETSRFFQGTGGVNKVFGSVGYKYKDLQVGVELNYYFGKIETTSKEYRYGLQYGTREIASSSVSSFAPTFGLMYNKKVDAKNSLFLAVAYTPEVDMKLTNERDIAVVEYYSEELETVKDDLGTIHDKNTLKSPSDLTIGVGFGQLQKYSIGAEVSMKSSNAFGNRWSDIGNVSFENGMKLGVGGYYIPRYNSFTNYWDRVTYRGGFNYNKTGMLINGEEINDATLTLGLGLPLTGTFSKVNVGVELGSRGTTSSGLVKENYFNLTLSLTLCDRWFERSRFQ